MTVRYRDGRDEKVDVLNADAKGLRVRTGDLTMFLNWFELDAENAAALRRQLLNPSDLAAPGMTVAGLRVTKRDGTKVEGYKLDWSNERELLLKTNRGIVTVPMGEVATIDDMTLNLSAVVPPAELADEILNRSMPADADGWDAYAKALAASGLSERSRLASRSAEILRHPEWPEHALGRALKNFRETLLDASWRLKAYALQDEAMQGRFERAHEILREIRVKLTPNDPAIDDAARIQAELAALQAVSMEARLIAEKSRQVEAVLLDAAASRSMTLAEAEDIARRRADAEAERRTAESFMLAPGAGDVREAWERRPADLRLIHSYGAASWLHEKAEPAVGEAWWSEAPTEQKLAYLKGLYVESARQVIRAESKGCPTCGGRRDVGGKTCPACKGLGRFRVVVYR